MKLRITLLALLAVAVTPIQLGVFVWLGAEWRAALPWAVAGGLVTFGVLAAGTVIGRRRMRTDLRPPDPIGVGRSASIALLSVASLGLATYAVAEIQAGRQSRGLAALAGTALLPLLVTLLIRSGRER